MIDLNNTWCEATQENFHALRGLGVIYRSENVGLGKDLKFYVEGNEIKYRGVLKESHYKQIKLNSNNEFEYAEESNYITRDINSKIVPSSDNSFEEKYNELLAKYDKLCDKYNDLADKYISVKYPEIEELKIKE